MGKPKTVKADAPVVSVRKEKKVVFTTSKMNTG